MLKQKIQSDSKEALKRKEELRVSVLRMVLGAIISKEKEKRYKLSVAEAGLSEKELAEKGQLREEEVVEVILAEVKKRKEAILGFEKGKRMELAEKEKAEIEVLKAYLPEQLSREAIEELAQEAVKKVGARNPKDMGKVMTELMPKVKGKAEGAVVSKIVKELLS